MGTKVLLSPPVCFSGNNLSTADVGCMPEELEHLRSSTDHMILSDSGIHLDLFHEVDDLADIGSCNFVESGTKDRIIYARRVSPSYTDIGDEIMNSELPSSSRNLENLRLHDKDVDSSMIPSDSVSGRAATVHRSKGRPTKLAAGGVGGCANTRGVIQCPVCSKNFNNSSALAKHKLIHSEERKYSCSVCSKAFKRQDHLNGHMMTHSSKKPYECKFLNCDKSYCDQRSLRRHIENHHQLHLDATPPPSGQMPVNPGDSVFQFDGGFLSSFSGQGIDPASGGMLVSPVPSVGMSPSLASQKTTWPFGYNPLDEPKPVKCVVCDRRFKNLPALNGHMRLHGGFVKKDVNPEIEGRKGDSEMEATKAGDDGCSKEPDSQSLRSEWVSSATNETEPASKLFCVKQEDVTADEIIGESITDYSDYLHTCGGRLRNKAELEIKSNCFLDVQSLKSEMLPAMEALQLKDRVDRRFSIDDASQLLAETFSDESNFSDDYRLSGGPQCLSYKGGKYGAADDRLAHPSSQSRDLKMMGSGRVGDGQQAVAAAASKYKMLVSSGDVFAGIDSSAAACGASQLCVPSSAAGNVLRRNIAGCKMRKATRRPLTPSYSGQRGFVLPCAASNVVPGVSSAQCAPLSPFADRAIYRANHDQAQPSVNSAIFEFPPSNNLLDSSSSIMSHSATPVHSSYSLERQHTPLSPYTPLPSAPYTPKNSAAASGHLSCFPFPPSTSGLIETTTCESPYLLHQKSASYHPYSLHHSSLPSPRYTQLHHHQLQQQQQQLKSNNFEHEVIQMNKEIEQHLQQFIKEDHKKNVLQLDQSYHDNQQSESDLYLQLGAPCLDSRQAGIREAFIRGQDPNINPPISFGKYPDQQKAFLDEKLGRERNEFDMELELDPLSILNLSNADKVLDKKLRFSEASVDQAIGDLNQLDVIDMLIMEDQYEDFSNEMAALDEIPNVDVLGGGVLSQVSRDIDLGIDILASEVMAGAAAAGDRCALRSVSRWTNRENLPRFSDVGKNEMFLNPNQVGSSSIKKKKRRPDPIIIPPCVNNFQTVTSPPLYSPDIVARVRKDPLPPAHPPPPYSALPINGLAKDGHGSFQVPFDVRTPQSAPTFHYVEDRLMPPDQSDGVIRREKPMFSWDQNSVNSLTETEIHPFQANSGYSLISDGVNARDRIIRRLSLINNSSKDGLGRFGVAGGGTEHGHQEHRVWKTAGLSGYQ